MKHTNILNRNSFHLAPSNSGTSWVRQSSGPMEHSRESSSTDIDPDTAIWCKNVYLLYFRIVFSSTLQENIYCSIHLSFVLRQPAPDGGERLAEQRQMGGNVQGLGRGGSGLHDLKREN